MAARSLPLPASPGATATDRRPRALPLSWPLIAGLGAMLGVAVPVLLHPYLPLVDLPNHIARHHIAAVTGGPLTEYYAYTAALVPNSAADLLWALIGTPGDAAVFSRWVMASATALLVLAAMALGRVLHGRWTAWPAAAGLVAYNANFLWGFENYALSAPFAILGLAGWIALERRPVGLRLAVFVPAAFLLYLLHFFAFAALTLMAFGREAQVLAETPAGRRRPQAGRMALLSLPFVVPLIGQAVVAAGHPGPGQGFTRMPDLIERIWALLSPFSDLRNLDASPDLAVAALSAGLVAVAMTLLLRRQGARLVLARPAIGPLVALTVGAALSPSWLNGVALVHLRFPFLVVALLLAGTRWVDLGRRQALLGATVVVALFAGRGVVFEREAARYSDEMTTMLRVLEALPEGSRLLPVRAPGAAYDRRFWHPQGLAVNYRDSFVPTLFQGVHAIRVLPAWQPSAIEVGVAPDMLSTVFPDADMPYLIDWQRKFTHVLLLDGDRRAAAAFAQLREIGRDGRFTLYRVTTADAAPLASPRPGR
ncbi:MAG: hypothetical protein ACOY5U_11310 [Pseudomonadota bacterium]